MSGYDQEVPWWSDGDQGASPEMKTTEIPLRNITDILRGMPEGVLGNNVAPTPLPAPQVIVVPVTTGTSTGQQEQVSVPRGYQERRTTSGFVGLVAMLAVGAVSFGGVYSTVRGCGGEGRITCTVRHTPEDVGKLVALVRKLV